MLLLQQDWAAVVLDYNYSLMGDNFAKDARALEAEVKRLSEERKAIASPPGNATSPRHTHLRQRPLHHGRQTRGRRRERRKP